MLSALLLGSYLLGNLLTAVWIGRIVYRKDIRREGSGNPGARNVGQVFGKGAAVLTFLGDALKGGIAVSAARWLGYGSMVELLALFAAVAGHIYPIYFRFRGGKGVSTFIGGLLFFQPLLVILLMGICTILFGWKRNFTIAGLGAIACVPFLLFLFPIALSASWVAFLSVGLLLFAHRKDLS